MPPRARKADDTVKVSVLLNVEISEAKWRAWRKGGGVDMTGRVTAGDIAEVMRTLLREGIERRAIPLKQFDIR